MITFVTIAGLLAIAYLLGSIPTGYLVCRWVSGLDIRTLGSGSIGATNVLRTVGKLPALGVLLVDILKGAIAVLIIQILVPGLGEGIIPSPWQPWLVIGAALAAILGHSKSIWLGFAGGKSVATSLGALLVMVPGVSLGGLAVFGTVLALTRYVSLSSILGAIAVNILTVALRPPLPYIIFVALAGVYVILRHRSNIERLLAGTEPKIGQKISEIDQTSA